MPALLKRAEGVAAATVAVSRCGGGPAANLASTVRLVSADLPMKRGWLAPTVLLLNLALAQQCHTGSCQGTKLHAFIYQGTHTR